MAATHKKQLTTSVRPGSLLSNQDIIAVVTADTDIGGRIASVNDLRFSTAAGLWLEWMPIAFSLVGGSLTATFRIVRPTILSSEDLVTEIHYGGTPDGLAPGPASTLSLPGLVGAWDCESANPSDWSGNGEDGTGVNGVAIATGKVGSALSFDGVNDYVRMNSTSIASDESFSVQFHVYQSEMRGANDEMFGKTTSGKSTVFFQYGSSYKRVYLRDEYASQIGDLTFGISQNTWVHIALVRVPGVAFKVYCNGLLVNQKPDNLSVVFGASQIAIGSRSGAYPFAGLIDDLRVYNLSASDTQLAYHVAQVNSPGTWGPEIAIGGTSIYRPTWGRGLRRGTRPVYGGLFTRR